MISNVAAYKSIHLKVANLNLNFKHLNVIILHFHGMYVVTISAYNIQ